MKDTAARIGVLGGTLAVGLVALCACAGQEESRGPAGEAGGGPPAAQQPLNEGEPEAKVVRVSEPCDPATDGWMAQPVPIPEDVIEKIKKGEPAWIPYPEGYEHLAPFGVPYCATEVRSTNGVPEEEHYWAVRCRMDSECPAGAVCFSGACVARCESTSDCSLDYSCIALRSGEPTCHCDATCHEKRGISVAP